MRIVPTVACVLFCLCGPVQARLWRSVSGKELEAEYVRCVQGVVFLKTPEGRLLRIQLSRLSAEDRAFVETLRSRPGRSDTSVPSVGVTVSPGDPKVVAQMQPGKTLTRKAEGETGITYHLYVPTSFKTNAPPPIIIAFSPGGSGKQMVNALKASAEKAGWLLAGCDKLSNRTKGEADTKMGNEVLTDILKSVPHQTERKYLAGFSGGTCRCYSYASVGRRPETYAGILAFGGWLGGEERRKRKYTRHMAVAQINGDKDKGANTWTKGDAEVLEKCDCAVQEFKFPGGHKIAPPEVIDKVIIWLEEQWQKRRK
jgi:hypothetical protein